MKAFHTIAIPHRDILEGRLTMDVFAADLGRVCRNEGPDEYRDSETFFQKTFLIDRVEKRLEGEGGEPVTQLQTTFGGSTTQALIAMYHNAKGWKVKSALYRQSCRSLDYTIVAE